MFVDVYSSDECPSDTWLNEGDICAVQSDSQWHRGQVQYVTMIKRYIKKQNLVGMSLFLPQLSRKMS